MSCAVARTFVVALLTGLFVAGYPRMGFTAASAAHLESQNEAVGRISMTLGQAHIFRPDGSHRSARSGDPVWVGDRIETAAGGHVHIRFVDDALVSVRPASRLVIEDYQYDSSQVHQSLVRFRLDIGVARSISGAAAEGARERFRLNTPLAVIGVRGTDFVVRADAQQTQAVVNQGAITMAPLVVPDCQAHYSTGCGESVARLLSAAEMPGMLMQYRSYFAQPQLLRQEMPPWEGGVVVAQNTKVEPTPATLQLQPAINQLPHSTTGQQEVLTVLAQDTVQQAFKDVPVIELPSPEAPTPMLPAPMLPEPTLPEPTLPEPMLPEPMVPALPPESMALAWGRWTQQAQDSTDISQLRELARQGRSVTVGNNAYVLYRQSDMPSLLGASLGRFDMNLQAAHASLQPTGGGAAQTAQVHGGLLTLDFGAQNFYTQLQLSAQATSMHTLEASGNLNENGIFSQRLPSLSIGGAVALDGQTAGYFFEKAIDAGSFSGITLWGR